MSNPGKKKRGRQDILFHELVDYWLSVIYLALVFAACTKCRRLVLAAYDITYTNYWVAVTEALILGEAILLGEVLRAPAKLRRERSERVRQ